MTARAAPYLMLLIPKAHPDSRGDSMQAQRPRSAPTPLPSRSISLELLQDLRQKVLEAEGNVPIPIVVVLLEDVRHALQRDAGLDEQVEAQLALVALVVGLEQQLDEAVRQTIAEGDEGVGELVALDVARVVRVEAVEQGAPAGEERPQPAELVEADGARAVAVEHPYHHAHRVRVEGRPVAVDKRRAELPLGELSRACAFCP